MTEPHVAPELAGEYAANLVEPSERARIEAHVDQCASCRELLSAIARAMFSTTGSSFSADKAPGPDTVLPRGTKVGHFSLEQPLGAGGMGLVYLAYDSRLDRHVALKCVRERRGDVQQLLSEARIMAQLAHPNVVPVYDVIEADGQTFIAMELVVGRTLRQWLDSAPRTWEQIVDLFLEAGAGLSAAHQAGIVHGDVKPGNVLVGKDERVRVTDFGLASVGGTGEGGVVRGTEAYLAPEQRKGATCDAKSDQYAFAVSLNEALTGSMPGQAPRKRSSAPASVRRVVERALSTNPADRFPSMRELLAALRSARAARWRWVVAAVALTSTFALLAFGAGGQRATAAQCEASALSTPWTATARDAARAAFDRTKLSYAAETFSRVDANLAAWQRAFDEARSKACAVSFFSRGPSPTLPRQLACLEENVLDARALVAQLNDADVGVVLHASAASQQLRSPLECTAVSPEVTAVVPAEAEAFHEKVAATRALAASGKYQASLELAKEANAIAERSKDPHLRAAAKTLLGGIHGLVGEFELAATTLREAIRLSEVVHDDRSRCFAWSDLLAVEYNLGHTDQVLALSELALGACERIDDVRLLTDVISSRGSSLSDKGRYAEAKVLLEDAVRRRELAYGPKDRRTSAMLSVLANTMAMSGDLKGAIDAHRRALEGAEAGFGLAHPETAIIRQNLGDDFLYGLDLPPAVQALTAAVDTLSAANGPKSRGVAIAATDLAFAHLLQGDARRAFEVAENTVGVFAESFPKHPVYAMALLARHQAGLALGTAPRVDDLELALTLSNDLPPFEKGRVQLALGTAITDPKRAQGLVTAAKENLATTTLPLIEQERRRAEQWLSTKQ